MVTRKPSLQPPRSFLGSPGRIPPRKAKGPENLGGDLRQTLARDPSFCGIAAITYQEFTAATVEWRRKSAFLDLPPKAAMTDAVVRLEVVEDGVSLKNGSKNPELKTTEATEGFPQNDPAASPVAKILFLDGVRGVAVVFVVTQHSGYMHDVYMGAVGVDAFFVLSSFLLTMLFMKKSIKLIAEQASYRKWGWTLADYFSKRFFRVYPLFALVAITLWLMPFEYKQRYYKVNRPEDFNLFQTLTFHPEHRHYLMWTLPLEISYYFILPVFVLAVLKMRRFWWMAFLPLYVWAIHEGLYTTRDNYPHQPLSKHLPTFVAGSMAAVIFKLEAWIKRAGFKFNTLHIVGLRVLEAVLIAAYLSVVFRGLFFNWLGMPLQPSQHYIMPFTSVKLSLLFVIEMIQPSTVSLIFEWIVLRYLGKISFSVYLLHVFVIATPSVKLETNYYDKTFEVFTLVILLATVSYYTIEYPSQLLAQRLSRTFNRLASYSHEKVSEQADTAKSSMSLPQLNDGNEIESEPSTTNSSSDDEVRPQGVPFQSRR